MISPEFSAVLLAGGKSTRMGCDKSGLIIHGRALWDRQLETLRATGAGELFISGREDGPYSAAGVPIVADERAGLGPLGGIVTALRRARFEYLLVLAIDLPAMTSDYLGTLVISALRERCGVVPADGEQFEPMAAVYTRGCLLLVDEHLRLPDHSMQRFIREAVSRDLLQVRPVASEERALFHNVNKPSDLAGAS